MSHRTLDEYLKHGIEPITERPLLEHGEQEKRIAGFFRETQFQETSIGKLPKEWKITLFRNVASINTNTNVDIKLVEGKVARIPMELIPESEIYAKYELTDVNNVKSYIIAKAGDVLLAKITPSFENGKQGIVPEDVPNGIAFVTTEVYSITPLNINKMYLFYLLKWKKYRRLLEYKMTGTTGRRRVPRDALENLLIPLPPPEEQWGIAEVLSSVDRAIEATGRLIERLEQVKSALMQELLTRGIGHKEFQETPIGKIPEEWKIIELKNLCTAMYYGITAKAVEQETGLRLLRTTDIDDYKVNWNSLPYCEITADVKDIKKYLVRKGDIIVSRAGTVGISVLADRDFDDVVFGSYLIKVRPKDNLIYPKFLHYYFQSEPYWKHISRAQGSTLKNINLDILRALPVPLPPLEEQVQIADILKSVDSWIELEVKRKEKLGGLKHGLMELLLSGRVRVRVEKVSG